MSLSLYLRSVDGAERVIPIAGSSELESLWRPIIAAHDLHHLDYILSAGLSVNDDNYADVVAELETLCREIAVRIDAAEHAGRSQCVRLLALVQTTPPGSAETIYIG